MVDPTTPDSWPTEPPAWLGDIAAGVDAWTQRAAEGDAGGTTSPASRRSSYQSSPTSPDRADRSAGGRGRRAGGTGRRKRPFGGSGLSEAEQQELPPPEPRSRKRRASADSPAAQDSDPEALARKILLDQLTGAARTRAELRKKLDAKEVPEEIAERLLDRFTEVGLIDDQAFAEYWVQGRQRAKGLAPRAIAQELRRKGVDDEVAKEALSLLDEDSQVEAARDLVRKKIRSLRRFDRTTATRRLVAMLARKGYGGHIAFSVVKEELDAAEFPDTPDTD